MNARVLGMLCAASALLLSLTAAEAKPREAQSRGAKSSVAKSSVTKSSVAKSSVAKSAAMKPRRADPARNAERARVLPPLEAAATACFAETIDANPTALAHARAGRWYEAASVGGYLCRPEVAKLMRAHDVFDGAGAGARYFRGPYVRRLGTTLSATLAPGLTRHAVADALPPAEAVKASATDADTIPAEIAKP